MLPHLIEPYIEAIIFASPEPCAITEVKVALEHTFEQEISEDDIHLAIQSLTHKFEHGNYAFTITTSGGGYQFTTKPLYEKAVVKLLKLRSKKRLSSTTLETLAIIAYKQPITKAEIETLRGVNSDYAVSRLLEKELITIKGKSDAPGRPTLFATSAKFLDYFGINSLTDLPKLKDLQTETENTVGTPIAE